MSPSRPPSWRMCPSKRKYQLESPPNTTSARDHKLSGRFIQLLSTSERVLLTDTSHSKLQQLTMRHNQLTNSQPAKFPWSLSHQYSWEQVWRKEPGTYHRTLTWNSLRSNSHCGCHHSSCSLKTKEGNSERQERARNSKNPKYKARTKWREKQTEMDTF